MSYSSGVELLTKPARPFIRAQRFAGCCINALD